MTRRFAFQQAHHNFYRAAQFGLAAELAWPLEPELGRERALAAMLERYLEHQRAGQPVHTRPVP
jgi:hypothetical protein